MRDGILRNGLLWVVVAAGIISGSTVNEAYGWSPSAGTKPHYLKQPAGSFAVRSGHPRLFFTQADLDWMKARRNGAYPLSDRWSYLKSLAQGYIGTDPSTIINDSWDGWQTRQAEAVVFVGLVETNAVYKQWAINWGKALAAAPLPAPNTDDEVFCSQIWRLAMIYDWLYADMSDADRTTLRNGLTVKLDLLKSWSYISNPGYIGGHERCYGFPALIMGTLAIYENYPSADTVLAGCRKHIMDGFFPTQQWIAGDGSYHMGWAYSRTYTEFDLLYYIWTVGTTDVALDDWMGGTLDWYVYGLHNNNFLPQTGDAFNVGAYLGDFSAIYAAGINKSGLGMWYLENMEFNTKYNHAFLQMFLLDPAVQQTPPSGLPKDRLFANAGTSIVREDWNTASSNSTHYVFKSSPYYSLNHHHRDENTFTLFYKGPLLIDSGCYDAYNGNHWRNYYTRTVAHNGIVVYNPGQAITLWGDQVSNDGGQIFKEGETFSNDGLNTRGTTADPRRLTEIQPGGWASLGGIARHESRTNFVYSRGDATKAYDPAWVTLAQRESVYLRATNRAHPVIVIMDRVGSTVTNSEKRFLLHTVNAPVVNGKIAVHEANGGRLSSVTLYPTDATLSTVGGVGAEFTVNGTNYPLSYTPWSIFTPGAWRIEVAAPKGRLVDYFLHALFVDDSGNPAVTTNSARLLSGTDYLGLQLDGWVMAFPKATGVVARLDYAVPSGVAARHLVTGLPAGRNASVQTNGVLVCVAAAGAGGCAEFALGAQSGVTVTVNSADSDGDGIPDAADADNDNDGLPDAWEIQNFGGTNTANGSAQGDWDGDGMCNLAEYIAGTSPTNAASVLKVQGAGAADGTFGLIFLSATGRVYTGKYCDDLLTGSWGVLAPSNVPGTGGQITITDTNKPVVRFYRLGVR